MQNIKEMMNWKMKRDLSYIVFLCIIMGFCGCGQGPKDTPIEDSSRAWNLIPDSVELYSIAESYPDSMKVAFTRNGKFEDSIVVYKYGFIKDCMGNLDRINNRHLLNF